jgi:hypothetical protein
MDFMLLLLGIASVAVFCATRSIVTGWSQPSEPAVGPRAILQNRGIARGNLPGKRKRELPSISIRECETLVRSTDVLFVSVNRTGEREPYHFTTCMP